MKEKKKKKENWKVTNEKLETRARGGRVKKKEVEEKKRCLIKGGIELKTYLRRIRSFNLASPSVFRTERRSVVREISFCSLSNWSYYEEIVSACTADDVVMGLKNGKVPEEGRFATRLVRRYEFLGPLFRLGQIFAFLGQVNALSKFWHKMNGKCWLWAWTHGKPCVRKLRWDCEQKEWKFTRRKKLPIKWNCRIFPPVFFFSCIFDY